VRIWNEVADIDVFWTVSRVVLAGTPHSSDGFSIFYSP
jgi:hypothetical protein